MSKYLSSFKIHFLDVKTAKNLKLCVLSSASGTAALKIVREKTESHNLAVRLLEKMLQK